jgi:hypothetical protein
MRECFCFLERPATFIYRNQCCTPHQKATRLARILGIHPLYFGSVTTTGND